MNPSAVLFGGGKRVSVRCPETRRERQRDRETERQRDRETEREREREREETREQQKQRDTRMHPIKTERRKNKEKKLTNVAVLVLDNGSFGPWCSGRILHWADFGHVDIGWAEHADPAAAALIS